MYDIVIIHGPNDDEILPHCVEHIKKNVGNYRHIYIISFDASSDIFEEENLKDCKVYDESVFPFSKADINAINQTPNRDGWYLQQLLKLYVSFVIEDMLDDYVIVDSDVLFLKPIEFKSGDKYLYNMSIENHVPYFEHMKRLHPSFEKVSKFSGISHHMIFNRRLVSELFRLVEAYHNTLSDDRKPFWKIFLEQVEEGQRWASGASEYEMYFNYMLKYHKDKIIPRKLRFEDTGAPVWYVLQNFANTDIAYAALHAWRAGRQPRPKRIKDLNMISGEAFQMLCDTTVITREIEQFHSSLPRSVKRVYLEGDCSELNNSKTIFVYTHILDRFMNEVLPKLNNKFILMTHNSDHSINETHLPLLNDERVIHMFSQNTFIEHPKLTALPIGIANSMWQHGQRSSIEHVMRVSKNFASRKDRIYVNVSEGTNYAHRSRVVKSLRENSLSDILPSNRPHQMYLEEMSGYKWVASPKGNGVDCHRLWEVMYSGSVAICDDSVNARAFRDMGLPIILVNDWDKITLEFLQEETKKLMVDFKGNRHHALNLKWWKSEIDKHLPSQEGSFVLVYLGVLRDYIYECIKQIRLWNPLSKVYLCINNNEQNKKFLDLIKEFNVDVVYVEELDRTDHHKMLVQRYTNTSMNNFWLYAMQRLFVVEEVMRKYNLRNIFHLEIDNLIYFKVEDILEKCKSINRILIPSDSERRYIAGLIFVNNFESLSKVNNFFSNFCSNQDEMHSLMAYTKANDEVHTWGVLPPGDTTRVIYENRRHLVNDIKRLSQYSELFGSVAESCPIGQWIGGIDPIHHTYGQTSSDGFINRDSLYDVSRVYLKWEKVNGLQRINMSIDKEKWYPVLNLHIHNKNLKRWVSDIPEMTKHLPNIL